MRKFRKLLTLLVVSVCSWQAAWAQEVVVSVSLAQAGELGLEILKKHDPITEVTDLTVTGEMNDDDWATLKNITALKTLNLLGVTNESVPASAFKSNSNLTSVTLPSNLKSIGANAFESRSKLVSVVVPSTLESLGSYAFNDCSVLETLGFTTLPAGVKVIPKSCFEDCKKLEPFSIPEGVTTIDWDAFSNAKLFKSSLPSTLKSIGGRAFQYSMEGIDVVLSEGCTIGESAFEYSKIKSIAFPTTYYKKGNQPISYCTYLTDVYLKSPTVLQSPSYFLTGCTNTDLKIHVPAHLLEAYKLDSYFKDYTIVGDATDDYTGWWTVSVPFNLSYNRMAGYPNIILNRDASLQVKGDATQTFGNILTYGHSSNSSKSEKYHDTDWSMIINTCDNVTVTGTYEHKIQTYEKEWYFVSLPFDFKVGDIVTEDNTKFAIRYYDGANRASTNATGSNWKNYSSTDIVPAGTGFILQTSATTWVTFKAQNNASKQYAMSNNPFVKSLADNSSEQAAHKGWNLVGNPWQSYYNIHKLGYSAPISVWTGSTYTAYSLVDDDYAICPNEAFFVQSPGSSTTITFPIDGRQLTKDITSQNAARRMSPGGQSRWIVDVQIDGGDEMKDKTRIVVNPKAGMDYETTCDASKFMSMDENVPQIYSLDGDDNQYAINERPLGNGEVSLGVVIRKAGQYTISAVRNSLGQVLLKDRETGITTDLQQNGYCFDANEGVSMSRFTLSFNNSKATGVDNVAADEDAKTEIYSLGGIRADHATKGFYVVRKGQLTQKMIIK